MNEKKLRVGIVGMGGIANGVHVPGLRAAKNCEITAICDINQERLNECGDALGIPHELRFTDYRKLILSDSVDAVEVCTPNYLHPEIAAMAIENGKPVNVEKPLGLSCAQAMPMLQAQKKHGTAAMVCFSYRFRSAVRYAKKLLRENKIGDILGVNVQYFKDSALWQGRRLEWRFEKQYAGTGVLGDLGVHLIDMVTYLIGDIVEVVGKTETIVKERKKLDSEEYGEVTTDDSCNFIATLENGKSANFSITRCALGQKNTIKFEVFGSEGVILFDLNNPEILGVCVGDVDVECGEVHYVNVPKKYDSSQEQTFVDAALGKITEYPTLLDGMKCQAVLDAVLESSVEKKAVRVKYDF